MKLYINGRFLQQPLSGVQRFALEITNALGQVWPGETPTLLVPPDTDTQSAPIPAIKVGTRRGTAWEQLDLPRHVADGFLLNLGNTGPAFVKRQAVIIHDTGVFSTPQAYSRAFVTYYRLLHRWLLRTDTRILTVSNASSENIRYHLGVPRHGISLITEGSDHMERIVADPVILTRQGLHAGRFALAVGNLSVHKNLVALSELAQRLDRRGISLVITGQLDATVFQTTASRLPNPAQYIGRVSDGELKALYQSAACFVFPSRYEGFGLPAVEAMACGCPVVASAIPALEEVCGGAALFVDPNSPADIAQTVERLLEDPELSDRLRCEGRQRAAMFTWKSAASRLAAQLTPLVKPTLGQTPIKSGNHA